MLDVGTYALSPESIINEFTSKGGTCVRLEISGARGAKARGRSRVDAIIIADYPPTCRNLHLIGR